MSGTRGKRKSKDISESIFPDSSESSQDQLSKKAKTKSTKKKPKNTISESLRRIPSPDVIIAWIEPTPHQATSRARNMCRLTKRTNLTPKTLKDHRCVMLVDNSIDCTNPDFQKRQKEVFEFLLAKLASKYTKGNVDTMLKRIPVASEQELNEFSVYFQEKFKRELATGEVVYRKPSLSFDILMKREQSLNILHGKKSKHKKLKSKSQSEIKQSTAVVFSKLFPPGSSLAVEEKEEKKETLEQTIKRLQNSISQKNAQISFRLKQSKSKQFKDETLRTVAAIEGFENAKIVIDQILTMEERAERVLTTKESDERNSKLENIKTMLEEINNYTFTEYTDEALDKFYGVMTINTDGIELLYGPKGAHAAVIKSRADVPPVPSDKDGLDFEDSSSDSDNEASLDSDGSEFRPVI